MRKTTFSVSMCVYAGDNPEWFREALESIIKQSLPPDEIVLVVDGPVSDKLNSIIEEYEQLPAVNVYRLEKNQGHGNARRYGLEKCKNELVALMDADDISDMRRFEIQIKKFEEDTTLDIVGGNIDEFIGSPENIVSSRIVPEKDDEIKEYLKRRCPLNQVTVMFKKSSVESVGGYIDWFCEEDYYLWLRMYLSGMKFYNCQSMLVKVRTGEDQYKRRGGLRYFNSEAALQKYMLDNKIISIPVYLLNVTKRFIVQLALPTSVRAWVFKKFARK